MKIVENNHLCERIKISSIIIAKNEEDNIRKCIESQLSCIDDIVVVVDDKSDDSTLEIVKEYNCVNFEIKEWMGYSKTKEYALSLTKHDWVFWIDADEVITKELQQEINKLKENKNDNFAAYSVARRAYFLGKWIQHSGWYPGRVTRFFNKKKVKFSDSKVHEELIVDGRTGKLNNDLEHYTDPDLFHYFEKFNKYTSLAAEELRIKQKNVSMNDILLRPLFIFIKMYILKKGFLDGMHGLILAILSSNYVFTKYCKLWEMKISS